MIGGQHVDGVVGDGADQRLAVLGVLDRGVALDQVAERGVVAAVEAQEVDAGLGGDLLAAAVGADHGAGLEQRQLVGGGDVQHVQAGAVAARERERQHRRLLAGLA